MASETITAPTIVGSATRPKVYKNLIGGEWVEASTGETFENRNPADTRDLVGIFQKSAKADVDAAVEAAKHAFAKWRLVPAPRRAEMWESSGRRVRGRRRIRHSKLEISLRAESAFPRGPVASGLWQP